LTMIGREYDSALTALQHRVIKLSLLGATLLCHREKELATGRARHEYALLRFLQSPA
jgi:hypothetical protein